MWPVKPTVLLSPRTTSKQAMMFLSLANNVDSWLKWYQSCVTVFHNFCSDQMSKSSFGFDFHPPCLDLCRIAQEILSGRITKACRDTLKVAWMRIPIWILWRRFPKQSGFLKMRVSNGTKSRNGTMRRATVHKNGDWKIYAAAVVYEKWSLRYFDVLQSVISMLCVFHSCKVVSHHISGDHVCYVQVDEAELSSSATLNC